MATGQTYTYYVVPVASAVGGGQAGPFSAGSPSVQAGAAATTPTITAVEIVTATATPATTANSTTAPKFATAGTGIAIVTYNEPVNCLPSAGSAFSYSNSGGSNGAGGKTVTSNGCYPARGGNAGTLAAANETPYSGTGTAYEYDQSTGTWKARAATCSTTAGAASAGCYSYNGATSDNSANTLIFTFPAAASSSCTVNGTTTTCYSGITIAAPGNGDTVTYTVPSTQTTSNSVYAGQSSSPVYEATGTVTSNGSPGPGDPTKTNHAGGSTTTGSKNTDGTQQQADPTGYGSTANPGSDPLYT
jgi:hypothetical protein